jgi:succinate dehydrogenase/fumarate reductase flavoprotein subunit
MAELHRLINRREYLMKECNKMLEDTKYKMDKYNKIFKNEKKADEAKELIENVKLHLKNNELLIKEITKIGDRIDELIKEKQNKQCKKIIKNTEIENVLDDTRKMLKKLHRF